jgi:hypothetical protein
MSDTPSRPKKPTKKVSSRTLLDKIRPNKKHNNKVKEDIEIVNVINQQPVAKNISFAPPAPPAHTASVSPTFDLTLLNSLSWVDSKWIQDACISAAVSLAVLGLAAPHCAKWFLSEEKKQLEATTSLDMIQFSGASFATTAGVSMFDLGFAPNTSSLSGAVPPVTFFVSSHKTKISKIAAAFVSGSTLSLVSPFSIDLQVWTRNVLKTTLHLVLATSDVTTGETIEASRDVSIPVEGGDIVETRAVITSPAGGPTFSIGGSLTLETPLKVHPLVKRSFWSCPDMF